MKLEEHRWQLAFCAQCMATDAADLFASEHGDGATPGRRHGLDRRDDAERAIEPPALGDRVEVRADPDLVAHAGAAEQVAVGVHLDREPRVAEPGASQLVRRILAGPRMRAIRAGAAADHVELLEPLGDARRAHRTESIRRAGTQARS